MHVVEAHVAGRLTSMLSSYGRRLAAAIKHGFTKLNSVMCAHDQAGPVWPANRVSGTRVHSAALWIRGSTLPNAPKQYQVMRAPDPLAEPQPPLNIDPDRSACNIDAIRAEVEQRFTVSVERAFDQPQTEAKALRRLRLWPARLAPCNGQLPGSARLPDIPADFNLAAHRTQRTVFNRIGGEFMNDQLQ